MTWYIGICTTKKITSLPGAEKERGEFAVLRQMEAKGIEAFVPRKIEFVRQGKRRYPDPIASPYMPGYVFFNAEPEQFLDALECRGMARTVMALRKGDLRGERHTMAGEIVKAGQVLMVDGEERKATLGILDFREIAAEREAEAQLIIERNDRAEMAAFNAGDPLTILAGPFMDRAAKFIRLIERAGEYHPKAEVEIEGGMFGHTVRGEIDILDLRKVVNG